MLNTVAPKDAQGVPQVRQALSDADKKLVIDGALNACDANDGVKDGMIFDQLSCKFDPKVLACKGAKTDSCITMEQAVAIEKGFAGPKDSKGRQVYPGSSTTPASRPRRGSRAAARRPQPGRPGVHATSMDVDARALAAATDQAEALTATSRWTNLSTFSKPRRQVDLLPRRQRSVVLGAGHDRLLRADDEGERRRGAGDELEPAVPGAGHGPLPGRSGDARPVRSAHAVVDWVEKGTAPNAVPATGPRCRAAAVRCARTRSTRTTRAAATRRTRATSNAVCSGGPSVRLG
jgi:feruloyl esterase